MDKCSKMKIKTPNNHAASSHWNIFKQERDKIIESILGGSSMAYYNKNMLIKYYNCIWMEINRNMAFIQDKNFTSYLYSIPKFIDPKLYNPFDARQS